MLPGIAIQETGCSAYLYRANHNVGQASTGTDSAGTNDVRRERRPSVRDHMDTTIPRSGNPVLHYILAVPFIPAASLCSCPRISPTPTLSQGNRTVKPFQATMPFSHCASNAKGDCNSSDVHVFVPLRLDTDHFLGIRLPTGFISPAPGHNLLRANVSACVSNHAALRRTVKSIDARTPR